jgi:hypothetical protein
MRGQSAHSKSQGARVRLWSIPGIRDLGDGIVEAEAGLRNARRATSEARAIPEDKARSKKRLVLILLPHSIRIFSREAKIITQIKRPRSRDTDKTGM